MPVTIENPILNSPFEVPARHWRITDDGITDEPVDGRRSSAYFIPVPPPKKKGGQLALDGTGWTAERMEPNGFINQVREHVDAFRATGYRGVTPVTRELLEHWTDPGRERPLFFCQIEALETAIYLTELAGRSQPWIENALREGNDRLNPGLYRIAFKMATGSGKTTVMAMLIAWQALNKLANRQDRRFSDAFLIVTPGITIRDRLRALYPNHPNNVYKERDLLDDDQVRRLGQARILVTNFHAFLRRDTFEAASLTKKVLAGRDGDPKQFTETPDEMVRRVCRSLGTKKGIIVLNDEAHHCYQSAPAAAGADGEKPKAPKLTADERAEAKASAEAAHIWLNGLRAVKDKLGVRQVYDLSATPFFLAGSGHKEGTLFPWVVSDFGLIDAIESGIVKIPRVPVADDSMSGDSPTYRELWSRIRDDPRLPKKGRATLDVLGDTRELPLELEGALRSLYGHYRRSFEAWQQAGAGTPPVFIVVCQNTNTSKLIADWVSGWDKPTTDGGTVPVAGELPLFSNIERGEWLDRPRTLLIDSAQLESGGAMSPEFKRMAVAEIEEFKREFMALNPGRSLEDISDEDLLREAMNTIGKPGRLGEQIRCVVSVSMLTEGWDANTVTHILGVRAFKTQLLCEQVVGRGLRRVSYVPDEDGLFSPEYAEVYGVPFQFLPTAGQTTTPTVQKEQYRVHALVERAQLEQTFPRLTGYRYELPRTTLTARFDADSTKTLSTQDVPTTTELEAVVGEGIVTNLDDLKEVRLQEVEFALTKRVLDAHLRADDGAPQPWLFPQVLRVTREWIGECVVTKDHTFPQLLLLTEHAADAAQRIYHSIVRGTAGDARVLPFDPWLRSDRLHGRCRLHDDEAGVQDDQESSQPLRPGLPLGVEGGVGARGHGRGRLLRQERPARSAHPVHARGPQRELHPRHPHPRRHRRGRATEPPRRGHRRATEGQAGQGRHRTHALGPGCERPRRLRTLGLLRGHRSVERRAGPAGPHPVTGRSSMTPDEVTALIDGGETFTVEFKGERAGPLNDDELVLAVICLANGTGGTLLLGVEDDGQVTGARPRHEAGRTDVDRVRALVANRTQPPLGCTAELVSIEGVEVLIIGVPDLPTPVGTSDARYVRRALRVDGRPECAPYHAHEMLAGEVDRGARDWAGLDLADARSSDLDPLEFDRLRRLIREGGARGDPSLVDLSNDDITRALGLISPAGILRAGALLLFGHAESIRRHIPTHEVAFQVLRGTTVEVNESNRWPLFRAAEDLLTRFRARNTEEEFQFGLARIAVPTYVEQSFREAIANAFVHRDYTRLGTVLVQWHEDRLEISSPGGFPSGITLGNLLVAPPHPRSPILADAFKRAGLVERTGRGIDLIYEGQLRYGRRAPDYTRSTRSSVVVSLGGGAARIELARFVTEQVAQGEPLGLNDLLALNELVVERRLTTRRAAELMQLDEPMARTHLNRMVDRGLLTARGEARGRTYHASAAVYRAIGEPAAYVRVHGFEPLQQEQMILQYVDAHGRITRGEAAELCQTAPLQARRVLRRLVERGELVLRGQRRGAYYERSV